MTQNKTTPSLSDIDNAALDWLVALQSDNLSDEAHAELSSWLDQAPAHREAFRKAARLWRQTGLTDEMIAAAEKTAHAHTPGIPSRRPSPRRRSIIRHWRPFLGGAAVLAAACYAMIVVIDAPRQVILPEPQVYTSSHAENRIVTLADGSRVTLSGSSSLEVSYSEDERRTTLLSGAAYFDIEPDPARPFLVTARRLDVSVLGTAFEIRLDREKVRVSVNHGQVGVAAKEAESTWALSAGERISYSHTAGFSVIDRFEATTDLAWLDGRLAYQDAALADIIADVNRYHDTPVRIAGDEVRAIRVTTSFPIDQTDTFLSGLEVSHGLFLHSAGDTLVLSRRQPG